MTTKKLKLIAVAFCAAVVFGNSTILLDAVTAASASTAQGKVEPKRAAELTPQEMRGRAIYQRGEGSSEQSIAAFIGEIEVPASTLTCAGCHGDAGTGKSEGGIAAGNVTWQNLTKESGHTHADGRKHAPFTEATFARALTDGVDPDGNNLLTAMPRYRMSAEDIAALVAYLKRIETEKKQPSQQANGSR